MAAFFIVDEITVPDCRIEQDTTRDYTEAASTLLNDIDHIARGAIILASNTASFRLSIAGPDFVVSRHSIADTVKK